MPEKYVKRTNCWENLTPLDSSHLEVFLGIFWEFFIFLNSNLNFEFRPVWYRPKPEPDRTSLTGNRSNRTGSHLTLVITRNQASVSRQVTGVQTCALPIFIFKNFLKFFHFLKFKFKIWIWAGLKPAGTGTGPDQFDRLPVRSGFLTLLMGPLGSVSPYLPFRYQHFTCIVLHYYICQAVKVLNQ